MSTQSQQDLEVTFKISFIQEIINQELKKDIKLPRMLSKRTVLNMTYIKHYQLLN